MLREHNCRPLLKHSRNEFVSVHPFSLYRDKKIALLHLSAIYDGACDCRIELCLITYVFALAGLSDICKCKILHVLIRHATPHIFSKICQSDAHRAD